MITLPTSTTNITGLRAMSRGSSLAKELPIAGQIRPRIEACLARVLECSRSVIASAAQKRWPAYIRNCSTIGPSANAGK